MGRRRKKKCITLLVYPEEDDASRILGGWLEKLQPKRKTTSSNRRFIRFCGLEQSTRTNIENVLSTDSDRENIDIIAFYGHGTRCSLCIKDTGESTRALGGKYAAMEDCTGCDQCPKLPVAEALIDGDNYQLCSGRKTYAVACYSMLELGPGIVGTRIPGTAYFGYIKRLYLPPEFFPGLADEIGSIVNHGLHVLQSSEEYNCPLERYQAVADTVRQSLVQLGRRIRASAGGTRTVMEVFVARWRLSFRAIAVTKADLSVL